MGGATRRSYRFAGQQTCIHPTVPALSSQALFPHLQLLDGIAGIALGVVANPLRETQQARPVGRCGEGSMASKLGAAAAQGSRSSTRWHVTRLWAARRPEAAATHHNQVELDDLQGGAG